MSRKKLLEILELDSHASWEEVETRYRDLCNVWHPDRFQNKERLGEMAEQKMVEINAAFEGLKRLRDSEDTIDISAAFAKSSDRGSSRRSRRRPRKVNQPLVGGISFSPRMLGLVVAALFVLIGYPSMLKLYDSLQGSEAAAVEAKGEANFEQVQLPLVPVSAVEQELPAVSPSEEREAAERKKAEELYLAWISEDVDGRLQADARGKPKVELIDNVPVPQAQRDTMYQLYQNETPRELPINETPALIEASIACNQAKVRKLLDDDAEIAQKDLRGDTALSWAVRRRCIPVVRLLLAKGADVNQRSENGFTPYTWARVYGAAAIAELLAEAGADTEGGVYWRRFDKDSQERWLDYRHESVCRGGGCKASS